MQLSSSINWIWKVIDQFADVSSLVRVILTLVFCATEKKQQQKTASIAIDKLCKKSM